MTEETESLILEHLRHMRGKIDQVAADVQDLKVRVISLESHMGAIHIDTLRYNTRIDEHEERLKKIERRLDIL